jgi:hypothetical protein
MNDSDPPEGPDAPVGESASGRSDTGRRPSSRRAVLATGVAVLASLAGCPDALAGTNGPDRRTTTPASADAGAPTETTAPDATGPTTAEPAPAATQAPALTVAPDGDLVRPMGRAVSVWNGNPGPDDYWQWPRPGQPDTDRRLADHFAADRGLAPTGERGRPPVLVATSRLDPTARVTGVADGTPDVFTLGPTRPYGESLVAETLPDSEAERLTTAPVARGGQAFFVSPAVAEAGVTALAAEEIRRIYRGETENWRAVGGPDRDIHVVAGATSTPNGRMREVFLRRQFAVDVRFGQPRDRLEVTLDRDDAITYLPVGYTRTSLPVVDVVVDGATHDVTDPGYPTTVTHAAHAWDEFDAREGAFVDMLRSPVGQAIVAEEPRLLPYDGER